MTDLVIEGRAAGAVAKAMSDAGVPVALVCQTNGFSTLDLHDSYMAGFMASAEGWNGEYPLERGNAADRMAVERQAAEYVQSKAR